MRDYEDIEKKVNYMNEEMMFGENRKGLLFRNVDELEAHMKRGWVPNVHWKNYSDKTLAMCYELHTLSCSNKSWDEVLTYYQDIVKFNETAFIYMMKERNAMPTICEEEDKLI